MQLPVISLLIIVAIVIGNPAHAKPSMQVKAAVERVENLNPRGQNLVLPYGFNAESTGPVLGLGGMRKGFLQDQTLRLLHLKTQLQQHRILPMRVSV